MPFVLSPSLRAPCGPPPRSGRAAAASARPPWRLRDPEPASRSGEDQRSRRVRVSASDEACDLSTAELTAGITTFAISGSGVWAVPPGVSAGGHWGDTLFRA